MTYIDKLHDEMMNSAEYREAHEASEAVYELASALIGARLHAGLTQEGLAKRMGATQSTVARLEGGRSNPSAKTLERYAKATNTRLRISFETVEANAVLTENETFEEDVVEVKRHSSESVPVAI